MDVAARYWWREPPRPAQAKAKGEAKAQAASRRQGPPACADDPAACGPGL